MKRNKLCPEELSRKMLGYFESSVTIPELPSFDKFARSEGLTLSELLALRRTKKFDDAYLECNEIRRDYLIDSALTKRSDPSFVKFLLTLEYGGEDDAAHSLEVNVRTVD